MRPAARGLVALCVLIALADLFQVVWLGKGLGAVGGAVVYLAVATGVRRGARLASYVAVAMPVIPIAVFTGLAGATARDELVDTGMIAVFGLQLAAAGTALWTLVRPLGREPEEMR